MVAVGATPLAPVPPIELPAEVVSPAAELVDEPVRLFGRAVVGQIACQEEHVRLLVNSPERDGDVAPGVRAAVQITDCGDAPGP